MYTHTVSVLPPLVGVCGQSSDLFMDHWFAQKWTFAWYSSLCLMYSLMMGLYKFAGTYIIMYLYVFIQCVMHNCRCVFTLKCWSIICISTKYISMIRHVLHVWIIRVMNKLCMWHMYLFSCSYYFMSLQIIYVLYICKFVYLNCLILQVETVPLSPRPAEAARHSRSQRHRLMHRRRDDNLRKENRFWLVHLVSYNVALISDWCQIEWRNRLITIGVRVLGVNLQCAWSFIYIYIHMM